MISCRVFTRVHHQKATITRLTTKHGSSRVVRKKLLPRGVTVQGRRSFRENRFEVFAPPEARTEPAVTIGLDKVIDQGVRAVFERESIVRTDLLVGEIVRLAPGQASNSEIEAALRNRHEFVRKKVGDHEMITTRAIIAEDKPSSIGWGPEWAKKEALLSELEYRTPPELSVSYDGLVRICEDARLKGEEMTAELAALWLQQHEAVNRYVLTSTDQFLNIRGGAGVGKTYFMERLVRGSLDAGRPVALVAPYGEQSRVTLRAEAEKARRPDVARAFAEANTVAWLLNKARFSPEFRGSLRGADIYVDEASLLDNQAMLGLVSLARDIEARVIFQGDTKQLQAVGRGQPLAMLEKELAFGMHVGRIDVTRRQLKIEDKQLSRELSSGDAPRFCTAIKKLIERGAICRGGIEDAVRGILANRNAAQPVETIVLSSTHRLAEKVSEKLHEAYKKTRPGVPMVQVAALKPKELQPAELLSTANYKPGEMIEYQPDDQKPARMAEVLQVIGQGVQVKGQLRGAQELVSFDKVTAVYKRTTLERGPGEVLLLTQKIRRMASFTRMAPGRPLRRSTERRCASSQDWGGRPDDGRPSRRRRDDLQSTRGKQNGDDSGRRQSVLAGDGESGRSTCGLYPASGQCPDVCARHLRFAASR